ncbi:MAG: DUF2178 domain-containing protein [Candidatus Aenigmarchaeota archaeon]|nr:DUF2178 domain-containing protein [Candidatus Aenigmarchaeota archaeon]
MEIRNDKNILIFMLVTLISIFMGVVVLLSRTPSKTINFLGVGLISAGLIMFFVILCTATKPKTEFVVDERVRRINEKAGYHAGWMTLLSVTILFWADRIWSFGVDHIDIYYATLFVGVIAWSILRFYYGRKGDKE